MRAVLLVGLLALGLAALAVLLGSSQRRSGTNLTTDLGPLAAGLVVLAIGHSLYAQAITIARYYA